MRDWDLIDEELIRAAGELPPASRRLRRRILRAAKQAERRGRTRRRMLFAASLLLPLAALAGWMRGGVNSHTPDESAVSSRMEGASADGSPNVSQSAATNPWEHVDASISERRKRSQTIRGALY